MVITSAGAKAAALIQEQAVQVVARLQASGVASDQLAAHWRARLSVAAEQGAAQLTEATGQAQAQMTTALDTGRERLQQQQAQGADTLHAQRDEAMQSLSAKGAEVTATVDQLAGDGRSQVDSAQTLARSQLDERAGHAQERLAQHEDQAVQGIDAASQGEHQRLQSDGQQATSTVEQTGHVSRDAVVATGAQHQQDQTALHSELASHIAARGDAGQQDLRSRQAESHQVLESEQRSGTATLQSTTTQSTQDVAAAANVAGQTIDTAQEQATANVDQTADQESQQIQDAGAQGQKSLGEATAHAEQAITEQSRAGLAHISSQRTQGLAALDGSANEARQSLSGAATQQVGDIDAAGNHATTTVAAAGGDAQTAVRQEAARATAALQGHLEQAWNETAAQHQHGMQQVVALLESTLVQVSALAQQSGRSVHEDVVESFRSVTDTYRQMAERLAAAGDTALSELRTQAGSRLGSVELLGDRYLATVQQTGRQELGSISEDTDQLAERLAQELTRYQRDLASRADTAQDQFLILVAEAERQIATALDRGLLMVREARDRAVDRVTDAGEQASRGLQQTMGRGMTQVSRAYHDGGSQMISAAGVGGRLPSLDRGHADQPSAPGRPDVTIADVAPWQVSGDTGTTLSEPDGYRSSPIADFADSLAGSVESLVAGLRGDGSSQAADGRSLIERLGDDVRGAVRSAIDAVKPADMSDLDFARDIGDIAEGVRENGAFATLNRKLTGVLTESLTGAMEQAWERHSFRTEDGKLRWLAVELVRDRLTSSPFEAGNRTVEAFKKTIGRRIDGVTGELTGADTSH